MGGWCHRVGKQWWLGRRMLYRVSGVVQVKACDEGAGGGAGNTRGWVLVSCVEQ